MKDKKVKETRFRVTISTIKPFPKTLTFSSLISADTLEAAFNMAKKKAVIMQKDDPESKYFVTSVNIG